MIDSGRYETALKTLDELEGLKDVQKSITRSKIYERMGRLEHAIFETEEFLKVIKEESFSIQFSGLVTAANVQFRRGEFIKSFNSCNQANNLYHLVSPVEQGAVEDWLAALYHVQANLSFQKGAIDDAYKKYMSSLEIKERRGDKREIAGTLHNIGRIHADRLNYEKALEFQERAFNNFKEIENEIGMSFTLRSLILVSLELEMDEQAENYLAIFKTLNDSTKNKLTVMRYKYAKARVLKTKNRLKHRIDAQRLFEEILKDDIVDKPLALEAMIHLAEILLDELRVLEEERVLNEVIVLVRNITSNAKDQRSYSMLVNSLLLQSKLELFQGNVSKAQTLLNQGSLIATENNLPQFKVRVQEALDNIQNQYSKWMSGMSLSEQLSDEMVSDQISDYLQTLKEIIKK